jgi:hypothetical protein
VVPEAAALAKVPAVALQAKLTMSALSRSAPVALTAMVPPTETVRGAALSEVTVGQLLKVPEMATEPVLVPTRHCRATVTAVVLPARTSNLADPAQVVFPSVEAAVSSTR